MDKTWLKTQLTAGRSIESIAREVGKDPSTVSYWVRKHGLRSQHAAKHASKGGIPRDVLIDLVGRGLSSHAIARELGVGQTTVRHWLKRHGLSSRKRPKHANDVDAQVVRECRHHGTTTFTRYGEKDHYRCLLCRKERVIARRREIKRILVEEAGGRCERCGFDEHLGALQFHHRDPEQKEFGIALGGAARSVERARAEAAKCALLCANCHAVVEHGVATLSPPPGTVPG